MNTISKSEASENILVYVGSTNKVKAEAARTGVLQLHPHASVEVIYFDAKHGITNWRSTVAIGQPFGIDQTAFGAINRMNDCWARATKEQKSGFTHIYAVGFENGLVQGNEIGKDPNTWYDICITSIRHISSNNTSIMQGKSVATEFGQDSSLSFDDQVRAYHALIMPRVNDKIDLYLEWTKKQPGGPFSRADFLRDSLVTGILHLGKMQEATKLVVGCAQSGVVASLGPRYKNMLWMRDMAYMTPAYLFCKQKEPLLHALRAMSQRQCVQHELLDNCYKIYDAFGSMPIVTVPHNSEKKFLLQRLCGTQDDPYFQIQLWNFCKTHDTLAGFPLPQGQVLGGNPPAIGHLNVDELREYYHKLVRFRETIKTSEQPPKPSFALRCFIEGTLEVLTPGTRDSEIHFIRSVCVLCKDDPSLLNELVEPLANAFFFLYMNNVDAADGLPKGCDSRDIFADLLNDAKLLSNSCFLYEALQLLRDHAEHLEKSKFREHLRKAIQQSSSLIFEEIRKETPNVLQELVKTDERNFEGILSEEIERLGKSIQENFILKNGSLLFRDFIPGVVMNLIQSPSNEMIASFNPEFTKGDQIDPQGLSLAILQGLVPESAYEDVLKQLKAVDSPIGITVFVPISGKTQKEEAILKAARGMVVWPHIGWNVVNALLKMNMPESKRMAFEQREKLSKLGFGEWYALQGDQVIQGGDPQQGWSASSMIVAENALLQKFS